MRCRVSDLANHQLEPMVADDISLREGQAKSTAPSAFPIDEVGITSCFDNSLWVCIPLALAAGIVSSADTLKKVG